MSSAGLHGQSGVGAPSPDGKGSGAPFPNQSGDAQPGGPQAEVLGFRSYQGANAGLALMRDGNGTRSLETLMRYRSAAMAEFMRALRTLKALQAEQGAETAPASEAHLTRPTPPNKPERSRQRRLEYALPDPAVRGRTLHDAAALWTPNEPEPAPAVLRAAAPRNPALGAQPIEPDAQGHSGESAQRPTSNAPRRARPWREAGARRA